MSAVVQEPIGTMTAKEILAGSAKVRVMLLLMRERQSFNLLHIIKAICLPLLKFSL
jgi:hypothetical protein